MVGLKLYYMEIRTWCCWSRLSWIDFYILPTIVINNFEGFAIEFKFLLLEIGILIYKRQL